MAKISKEKWKIYGNVFDDFANRNLFKLKKHYEYLKSTISIGKEANVFSATTKENNLVIIKIYRLENCDFNNLYSYIKSDPRYINIRKSKRKIIFAWTQREFRNLLKAREAQVNCPTPIAFLNNILIEEFIGDKDAAPQLKDAHPENPKEFLKKVIINMKKLYDNNLIHGDLSAFNILNYNETPVFIDFSQASPINDPNAEEYLKRDCKNIANHFKKLKIDITSEEIFNQIT